MGDKYIERLSRFQIETISDALDSLGIRNHVLIGFRSISKGVRATGLAYTIKFARDQNPQNCPAADYIESVADNNIIIIDNNGDRYCTVWGNLLTIYANRKNIRGTVVYGACRDVGEISKTHYPLFSKYIGCKTGKGVVKMISKQEELEIDGVHIAPNDYVMMQDAMVIIIPSERICDVLNMANKIKTIEDKIVLAIKNGMTLKEARELYKYNDYK